jgi:hypothetical protein
LHSGIADRLTGSATVIEQRVSGSVILAERV